MAKKKPSEQPELMPDTAPAAEEQDHSPIKPKMSDMQAVRLALEANGMDIGPAELHEWIKANLGGMEVDVKRIGQYKSQIKSKAGGAKKRDKASEPTLFGPRKANNIAEMVIQLRQLVNELGADDVKRLVDALK